MKYCSKCNINKKDSNFYKKTKERLQSYCKECFNQYTMQRWIDRKVIEINKKGGECLDCKLRLKDSHYAVFEFHHLDPSQKDFNWTKLRLRSQADVDKELAKCVCLCANCHRIRHCSIH
jgi:hypothetical protein